MESMELTKTKRESNDEFVQRIMNYGCPTGALVQAFVIEALAVYSDMVRTAGDSAFGTTLISGRAWTETADWVKEQVEKKYGWK